MREKRKLLWFLVVVGVLCAALVGYAGFLYEPGKSKSNPGTAKPLTARLASTHSKVTLPAASTLEYGELFTISDNWVLAARFSIDTAKLSEFIATNSLPIPIPGLRPVPGRNGKPLANDAPAVTVSGSAAPTGSSATPIAAPAPLGTVLTDDPGWHPDKPTKVSGINRVVREGVARWFMFDLDDSARVIVYVYATAEVRLTPTLKTSPPVNPSGTTPVSPTKT